MFSYRVIGVCLSRYVLCGTMITFGAQVWGEGGGAGSPSLLQPWIEQGTALTYSRDATESWQSAGHWHSVSLPVTDQE